MPYGTGINIKLLYTGINTDTGMKVGVGDKTYVRVLIRVELQV